jgi:hypothetical protein
MTTPYQSRHTGAAIDNGIDTAIATSATLQDHIQNHPGGGEGDGAQGPQGPQGRQGNNGISIEGPQGRQGPQGGQGWQGRQGPQGWQGEKGDPGEPGGGVGNVYAGVYTISSGAVGGVVSGLGLSFTPSKVLVSVRVPANAHLMFACVVEGSLSVAGFTFYLSGMTEEAGYKLDYYITQ